MDQLLFPPCLLPFHHRPTLLFGTLIFLFSETGDGVRQIFPSILEMQHSTTGSEKYLPSNHIIVCAWLHYGMPFRLSFSVSFLAFSRLIWSLTVCWFQILSYRYGSEASVEMSKLESMSLLSNLRPVSVGVPRQNSTHHRRSSHHRPCTRCGLAFKFILPFLEVKSVSSLQVSKLCNEGTTSLESLPLEMNSCGPSHRRVTNGGGLSITFPRRLFIR